MYARCYVNCVLTYVLPRSKVVARGNRYFYSRQAGCFPTAFSKRFFYIVNSVNFDITRHTSLFVSEIVEGVRRGGGSPLRPVIDEASVEEEVNSGSKYLKCIYINIPVIILP